jgi:hypothetical protein
MHGERRKIELSILQRCLQNGTSVAGRYRRAVQVYSAIWASVVDRVARDRGRLNVQNAPGWSPALIGYLLNHPTAGTSACRRGSWGFVPWYGLEGSLRTSGDASVSVPESVPVLGRFRGTQGT